jgi:hypothetical protein
MSLNQRQHSVQLVQRIHFCFGAMPTVQHVARRAHAAIGGAVVVQQKELQLECACGLQPLCANAATCACQAWRGSDVMGTPVQRHTATGTPRPGAEMVPCSGFSVPGTGHARKSPSPWSQIRPVSCTSSPQISKPEDGDRHMPARPIEGQQFMPPDDLAAPDPVGIVQTISTASISGWASRKASASEISRQRDRGMSSCQPPQARKDRTGPRRRRRSGGRSAISWSQG